jgi:hypothetical protein
MKYSEIYVTCNTHEGKEKYVQYSDHESLKENGAWKTQLYIGGEILKLSLWE